MRSSKLSEFSSCKRYIETNKRPSRRFYHEKQASIAKPQSARSIPFTCACLLSFLFSLTAINSALPCCLYMNKVPRLGKFYGLILCFFSYALLHRNLHVEQKLSCLFRVSKHCIENTLVYIVSAKKKRLSAFKNSSCQLNFIFKIFHYRVCSLNFDSKFLYSLLLGRISHVKNKHVKEIRVEFSH